MVPPLAALMIDLYGRPMPYPWLRTALVLARGGQWRACAYIRLAQHFRAVGWERISRWATRRLRREFGCFFQPGARIGPGLRLPHPQGIVIGSGAIVGENCTIYHQVTLGAVRRGGSGDESYPTIGNGVTLFAGAKVIGPVHVDEGATVGANAVVNRDVPAHHVAVGVPASVHPAGSGGKTQG